MEFFNPLVRRASAFANESFGYVQPLLTQHEEAITGGVALLGAFVFLSALFALWQALTEWRFRSSRLLKPTPLAMTLRRPLNGEHPLDTIGARLKVFATTTGSLPPAAVYWLTVLCKDAAASITPANCNRTIELMIDIIQQLHLPTTGKQGELLAAAYHTLNRAATLPGAAIDAADLLAKVGGAKQLGQFLANAAELGPQASLPAKNIISACWPSVSKEDKRTLATDEYFTTSLVAVLAHSPIEPELALLCSQTMGSLASCSISAAKYFCKEASQYLVDYIVDHHADAAVSKLLPVLNTFAGLRAHATATEVSPYYAAFIRALVELLERARAEGITALANGTVGALHAIIAGICELPAVYDMLQEPLAGAVRLLSIFVSENEGLDIARSAVIFQKVLDAEKRAFPKVSGAMMGAFYGFEFVDALKVMVNTCNASEDSNTAKKVLAALSSYCTYCNTRCVASPDSQLCTVAFVTTVLEVMEQHFGAKDRKKTLEDLQGLATGLEVVVALLEGSKPDVIEKLLKRINEANATTRDLFNLLPAAPTTDEE
jgi:hypothetical protein